MSMINCLPPTQNISSSYGYFKITPTAITFFKNNIENAVIKVEFWGSSQPVYIPISSSEIYTISAPLLKFKQYLVDCKATNISIVDNRNYKSIATTFVHWLAYLRPISDKQIYPHSVENDISISNLPNSYYLPFYDQIIEVNLPLYSFNAAKHKANQKIGELMLKWQCRVWTQDIIKTNLNLASGNNFNNLRVSNPTNVNNPISICNIDLGIEEASSFINQQDLRTNKSIKQNLKASNQRLFATDYPPIRKTNTHANFRDPVVQLQNVRQQTQIDRKSQQTNINQRKKDSPSQLQMQLQLLRLRLDVQQLIKVDRKQEKVLLYILYFQSVNRLVPSKEIVSIDVECKHGKTTAHTRIFSQSLQKQKNYFYSSMITEINSSLTFSTSFKRDKKTLALAGSLEINCIGDSADVNMLSPQGVIIGFLRVKVERKRQIDQKNQQNKSPIIEEFKIGQQKKRIREKALPTIEFTSQLSHQQQIKLPKINKQQKGLKSQSNAADGSFFLAVIKQIKQTNKYDDLDYNIFNMNISHFNQHKFVFVSQSQMVNKPFQVLVFQKEQLVYHQKIIDQLKLIPSFKQSLTCSLLYEHTIPNLDVICQLYAGNLQQINYLLQQLTQPSFAINIKQSQETHRQNTSRLEQNLTKGAKIISDPQRKLKTEGIVGAQDKIRRMTEQKNSGEGQSMVAMEKLSMNEGIQSQNPPLPEEQNIYLVDLLTRFLDSLTPALFPSVQQIKKSQFIQIITKSTNSKSASVQMELIQIISSIFQTDSNIENINLSLVNQCYKAYQTFLKMYHQQKQQLIDQILAVEPKAINRIKANTEMETINESILWGRALQKVKDKATKQKINKFYKISSFNTTDCNLLLQDLQNKKQVSLRSLDISNLGMIVKEWVEQFINQLSLQNILPLKENLLSYGQEDNWLNIKNISEAFEECVGLRLSMWQSLMLIEEIKGGYSCDLQLEEGIISSNSLLGWINSIYGRNNKDNSQCSSSPSLDPEQLALIKNINKSQIQEHHKVHDKSVELSSMAMPNNNYSDVADIANLLREKDGYSPVLNFAKDNAVKSIFKKQVEYNDLQKRINTEFSDRIVKQETKQVQGQLETKQIQNRQIKRDQKIEDVVERWRQFYVQIRQLKLYESKPKSKLLKAVIKLSTQHQKQQCFYYLTADKGYSEANNQMTKFSIDVQKALYNESGLHIIIQNEQQKVVINGLLPIEDIVQWIKNESEECKKTIVLYEAVGQICGKLTVKLIKDYQQIKEQEVNKQNIRSNEENTMFLTINSIIPNFMQPNLCISVDENIKQPIKINVKTTLKLLKPIYQSVINISDENGQLSCTVSLEQLFLKRYIQADYPLINIHTAHFISTLTITMSYLPPNQQNIQGIIVSEKDKEQSKIENDSVTYMINEIDVMGYKFTCSFTAKLYCYIYKQQKEIAKDQLILVTPSINFKVKEEPTKYYLKQQRISLNQSDQSAYIQFKLMTDGTVLASTERVKMNNIKTGLTTSYICMIGHGKLLFCLGIKKLKIINTKYSLRRVYQCLEKLPQPLTQRKLSSFMKTLKQQYNLTVSQIQILKEIAQSNRNTKISSCLTIWGGKVSAVDCSSFHELFPVSAGTLAAIINQFMFLQIQFKNTISGALQKSQILRVLSALRQDSESTDLINSLEQVFEQMTVSKKDESVELPYTWIFILMQGKESPELSEKIKVIKQIDGLYQSMLHKYA